MYSSEDMMRTFLFTLVFGLVVGACIGGFCENGRMRDKAVENNVGHYDTKTGEFTWGAE